LQPLVTRVSTAKYKRLFM